MIITVMVLLCLSVDPTNCVERSLGEQPLAACTMNAEAAIAEWMDKEGYFARGYRLAKWGCVIGSPKVKA